MGVESEEGKGSTFWFEISLPLGASSCTLVPAGSRVLIAQSHAIHRRLTVLSLEKLGCKVDDVGSGRQVLERLEHAHYDAVLFERVLDDTAGADLAAEIRRQEALRPPATRRRSHLIAILPAGRPADRAGLELAGVDALVASPITAAGLKEALAGSGAMPGGTSA
jgi:CheY-like chemotaxis protein